VLAFVVVSLVGHCGFEQQTGLLDGVEGALAEIEVGRAETLDLRAGDAQVVDRVLLAVPDLLHPLVLDMRTGGFVCIGMVRHLVPGGHRPLPQLEQIRPVSGFFGDAGKVGMAAAKWP
jgi:hypothetical protein